ncbi:MAG: hypothetical protein V5A43_00845 [Haloarculaceae archaeon]
MADVARLLRDAELNAAIAWALVLVMAATVALSVLTGNLVWSGFAATVVVVALLPPLVRRSPRVMLPWEILLFAGLPILGRSVLPVPQFGLATTYLSVAAFALVVAVELHLFTAVKMSPGFAVLFVAVTTIAVAGVWGVVRWLADLYLGTTLLLVPGRTELAIERALMIEFVVATVIGVLAGIVFEYYFRRQTSVLARVPEETTE